ncbi:MAG: MMPL family transporter, partial [Thermoplasmata archaeon]
MSFMSNLGEKVSGRPKVTIAIIVVLTLIFTYFGSSFENDADPESFNPDHELIKAAEESSDTFGSEEYNLLVLVKTDDNNVLEMDDMKTLIEFEDTIRSEEEITSSIVATQNNPTGFASLADMLVMSYGLLQGRTGIDYSLMGQNFSLHYLISVLNNASMPNAAKAAVLDLAMISLEENLTLLQSGNNGIPEFNKDTSLATLDDISAEYGPDPVPNFLKILFEYDAENASLQTSNLLMDINSTIDTIKSQTYLLSEIGKDPDAANFTLDCFWGNCSTIEAGAQTLDAQITGLYFGAMATLTRDFGESGGLNAKGAIININFDVSLEDEQRYNVEKKVRDIANAQEGDLEYGVLGNQLINQEIQETMDFSQMFLLMLVFVLIVLILFITFRSGFDTVLTLVSLGMAIIWSYGVSILLGIQGSIIATVVPILLVGLGVDYGIHMTMRFREEKGKGRVNTKAITIAIGTVGMALLLATITTGIGFMSNTVSSLTVLKDFAIMVTVGIVSSFIIMTTFLPAVRLVASERKERKKKDKEKNPKANNFKNNSKKHAVSIVTIGAKAGDRAPWAVLIILFIIS